MHGQRTENQSATRKNWILTAFIITGAMLSELTEASNICRSAPSNGNGQNSTAIILNSLRPYYDVNVGDVLGTGRIDSNVTCYEGSNFTFVMNMNPSSPSETSSTICSTPLDGVGIRFKDSAGHAITCNAWSSVLHIQNPQPGSNHRFFVNNAVEFIRTKTVTSLPAGLHPLRMPTGTHLGSYLSGSTNGRLLGNYVFTASTDLLVSQCVFADASRTVDFQTVSAGDLSSSVKPFSIQLRNCGDRSAAEFYNGIAKFRFTSTTLLSDGTLGNATCATCAEGVAIEVTNDQGTLIRLNQDYRLNTGTFTITGDSIEHKFKAKLKVTGATVKAGRIDSILTVVVSSI